MQATLKTPKEIRDEILHTNPYKDKSEKELIAYATGVLDAFSEIEKQAQSKRSLTMAEVKK